MRLPAIACLAALATTASALTEREIQGLVDQAVKAGGGEVVIPPGTHLIERGLVLRDAKKIRLVGLDTESCVLKLPPVAFAETANATPAGATRIATARMQGLRPAMQLHIEADGEMDAFTQNSKPYVLAVVKSVDGAAIQLAEPLKFPVPAGALVRDEHATLIAQQPIDPYREARHQTAGRIARNISFLPGGPGRRSIRNPHAPNVRRTSPLAQ